MTDTATETVTITIDGRQVQAQPGEMLIAAAERSGTYIPRFCYHPRMKPVGMCRMCLVEVNGPRGPQLVPSCFVPVAEGQEVITTSERVKKAQDGVLEFLLVNHPLDCPVCDKGGECPLQDQTFAYGPGESRFVEEKRHWEKPIALSDLVLLDRERCIQCSRCTRFANEIAGDPLIEFINRGERTEVNVFPDEPFSSYFSGNTVQICPVGALTSEPYRFKARPWDLAQVESTCTTCSVGCRMNVQSSADKLVRYLGIDSDPVNQGWLCDKGRYNFENVNAPERLLAPVIRKDGELIEISWAEALEDVVINTQRAIEAHGPASVGLIGGARLANEDAYAWTTLLKGVIGTDNVDCQLGDGLTPEFLFSLPEATIDDACHSEQVVLLAPDLKEELPVLYLRLRQAAVDKGVELIEIAPHRTGLTKYASRHETYLPGDATSAVRNLIDSGVIRENAVVVLGRPSVAESADSIVAAASLLADISGSRFLFALRRGNVRGALELGMTPGFLPGRVVVGGEKPQDWVTSPTTRGLSTIQMLQAGAEGKLDVLFLLGADPLIDVPDAALVSEALSKIPYVVAIQAHPSGAAEFANTILPTATFGERGGTTTNLEGRVSRLAPKITAPGVAWPDWTIALELIDRFDVPLEYRDLDGLLTAITAIPTFAPLTGQRLSATDGIRIAVSPLERPVAPVISLPRTDQYKLRVISDRSLYDYGSTIAYSPSLIRLAHPLVLKLNPSDLSRLGVEAGSTVCVKNETSGEQRVMVESDSSVPKGCVWLPFAAELNGIRSNLFLSSKAVVNEIVVESAQ